MSNSVNMSTRSGVVPVNKCLSNENLVSKAKDDRISNNNSKFKHRSDSGHSSKQYDKKPSNNYNKQQRSRGAWGGKRTPVTKEQPDEMGGRKVNFNHLLKFTYDNEGTSVKPSKFVPRSTGRGGLHKQEHFIQANCQLLIKESVDCEVYSLDPDVAIAWEHVEKVNMWSCESPACPICLYQPYAARITKCGHIFCWPCILHYLALDDKSQRKCPICHETVKKEDLKSVTVHPDQNYGVDDVITMRLMKRTKGSIVSFQNHQDSVALENCHKLKDNCDPQEQRNMKYLVATPQQILHEVVAMEREQLDFKLATESDEHERLFIGSASELCKIREEELISSHTSLKSDLKEIQSLKEDETTRTASHNEESIIKSQESGNNTGCNNDVDCDETKSGGFEEDSKSDKTQHSDYHIYYFYQSADGQHIYLHPINFRCLHHQYESFENYPAEISGKVVEIERMTMNEVMRKKHRYLSHLPLSLEFCVVELDLRPPVVSQDTLGVFRDVIEHRIANRRRKTRDEKRILKKAKNEALRRQGKFPAARISLENQQQFPQMRANNSSAGSFSVLLQSSGASAYNNAPIMASPSSRFESIDSDATSESLPSFAQMLKSSRCDNAPSWRRHHVPVHADVPTSSKQEEHYDDDYVTPPTYQSAFGEALSSALEQMAPPSGRKSKKGKKSKVLLFSTSSQQHQ